MADNSEPVTLESPPPKPLAAAAGAEPPDAELVSRVVGAGDEAAFEQLFHRHRRRVTLIASRFFSQREQMEDIVQESFTKAYFALPDFNNEQDTSFAAWLARIAFNACYDELRRIKRRPESAISNVTEEEMVWLREQVGDDRRADDIESGAVARDLAAKLLSRLSPEDRLVLVMLDVEGMSVAEIAESNNWSISKVKVRAHRARAHLRSLLRRFL
ncbi:MAG TPA: sigma-70 family RNA polymerase sigma factor [Pyrinomonadaceae bacterium]|nr:sigma-70 family RNA polymerase sigma factor [Pyrinomonadaceae bacterium]